MMLVIRVLRREPANRALAKTVEGLMEALYAADLWRAVELAMQRNVKQPLDRNEPHELAHHAIEVTGFGKLLDPKGVPADKASDQLAYYQEKLNNQSRLTAALRNQFEACRQEMAVQQQQNESLIHSLTLDVAHVERVLQTEQEKNKQLNLKLKQATERFRRNLEERDVMYARELENKEKLLSLLRARLEHKAMETHLTREYVDSLVKRRTGGKHGESELKHLADVSEVVEQNAPTSSVSTDTYKNAGGGPISAAGPTQLSLKREG